MSDAALPTRKHYDLEDRTCEFAKRCRAFIKALPRTLANIEDARQLVRSSGSVAANYIEANESISKKDFAFRIKIARKEAKESRLWLRLCEIGDDKARHETESLISEAVELGKIFGAILERTK
jgi:four helix bundle protein